MYENRSDQAHFGLLCVIAFSNQAQNLLIVLKLAVLHILFSSLSSPSMSFLVSQEEERKKERQAWAELCQAQYKLGLAKLALPLTVVVFHLKH